MQPILAIDPGKSGGLAYRNKEGAISLYKMPDTQGDVYLLLAELLVGGGDATCYMELVGGFIQGNPAPGSAMFTFGEGFGFIKGVLMALGTRLELVRPQVWQKSFEIGKAVKRERKLKLKAKAQQLYPAIDGLTEKTCDALLILDYAIRKEKGQ